MCNLPERFFHSWAGIYAVLRTAHCFFITCSRILGLHVCDCIVGRLQTFSQRIQKSIAATLFSSVPSLNWALLRGSNFCDVRFGVIVMFWCLQASNHSLMSPKHWWLYLLVEVQIPNGRSGLLGILDVKSTYLVLSCHDCSSECYCVRKT